MSIYKLTLDQLVQRLCRLYLHDYKEGITTAGGSTTTLVDTTRTEQDDYFINMPASELFIRTGTYADTSRTITDWVKTTGTLTFAPVVGGAVPASVEYAIHSIYPRAEVVAALNQAIDLVAEEAMVWQTPDVSTTLVADTYEYTLPTSFLFITRVTMSDADGAYPYENELPANQYRIIRSGAPSIKILEKFTTVPETGWHPEFHNNGYFTITAARTLRIEGLGSPATLSASTDTCSISPGYLCPQASAILHAGRIARAENDPEMHQVQFQAMQAIAERERMKTVGAKIPRDAKRVME